MSTTTTTTTTIPILTGYGYCTCEDIENYIETEVLAEISNDRDYLASSTLFGDITADATTLTLVDSGNFPVNGKVLINQEEIEYTSNAANVLGGLKRGVNYSVATIHPSTAVVKEILAVNTLHVQYCIDDASAEIETYLGLRFSDIPLTSVPRCIRKACIDITAYNLFMRRESIPPQYVKRYNDCLSFLQRVVNGKVSLDSTSIYTPSTISSNTYSQDLVFTTGSLTRGTTGSLDDY